MSEVASSCPSSVVRGLSLVVAGLVLGSLGLTVAQVVAQVTGGTLPPGVVVYADPISDAVSATAAEFRVDESGAATYDVPLYAVPGTAGVEPRLSLSYSSQGGYGPLGKGWSIGGLSSITRCRATREAGDFLGAATPDGDFRPINFSASDRFCLDGQRLVPAAVSCPATGGTSGVALATEIDSFRRVCAYTANAALGPSFFTVEGKDGSISWYGDRDNNGTANRPDGYVETTSPLRPGAALFWAQTRFQDSTGNYIDYVYAENPSGAGTGEHLLAEVRYTGKTALTGQSATHAPYAKLQFNYNVRPAAEWTRAYVAGGVVTGSHRLDSITSCATAGSCAKEQQARHTLLTYSTSPAGSGMETLVGLQECRDNTAAVCSAPTAFLWGSGAHQFASYEKPANLPITTAAFRNFKLGDINGDGRPDMVYLRDGSVGCGTQWLGVLLSTLDGAGSSTFSSTATICLPTALASQQLDFNRGDGAWNLLDYNGDGRDDLFVSGPAGQGWQLYPSNGSGFDMGQNLLAGMAGIIPSSDWADYQSHLADLNGDGLTDVVYSNGGLRARLMERQGAGFGWGAERVVQFDTASLDAIYTCAPEDTCTNTPASLPSTLAGFTQLADFNGDAASDLLVRVTTRIRFGEPICDPLLARSGYDNLVPDATPAGMGAAAPPCVTGGTSYNLATFGVQSLQPGLIVMAAYGSVGPAQATAVQLADFNGDGLTDTAFRHPNGLWYHSLSTGTGMRAQGEIAIPGGFPDQVKFADANGDGRADVLYLVDNGNKVYYWRRALPSGGFATGAILPGGNARHCEGNCNVAQSVSWFADMDGDGNQDFMSLGLGQSSPSLYVSRSNQRFVPRDVITRATNGLGLETDISYASLTNAAVYRRDTGSRNGLNWGRGSPVMDLLTPNYVVAKVASTSPVAGNPNAKATVHYRYAGGRIQGGGRGFLGFREIATVDTNQPGGHVVTTTTYAQNFPFVGMPVQTVKSAVVGQGYAVSPCLTGTVNDGCFATPGQAFPSLGGSWFSNQIQSWEAAPAALTVQTPIHARTQGSEEYLRDPYTGVHTSRVATAFSYGANGNVSQTVVDTYTGDSTLVSTLITSNSYTDDVARWRLGRLTASTITHRRPGQADVVRTTGFGYAMGGAATGLLNEERIQPGGSADLASSKVYALDEYGNRLQSTTCAAPATNCSTAGFAFHPAGLDAVKRYSRVEYDASGRFPVATYEPFWSGASAQELRTTFIADRDIFGNPVNTLDVNNVRTMKMAGLLGRDYFTWVRTAPNANPGQGGASATTTYRWCGSGANAVQCPDGARFRQQVAATESPRQWTYFDAMGRPLLKAVESFNAGVSGQDVSAVCTQYDTVGRPTRTSNPFFLPGVAGTAGPAGLGAVCASGERLWTTTHYDILGRVIAVQTPDGNQVTTTYAGLSTTTRDQRNHPTTQVRNGKGELVRSTDANGMQTDFAYTADGNLRSVSRNAGNGVISNSFVYDVLGRKIQQNDPDTGTTLFQYNALGELIAQTDNGGYRVEHELDARGRVWRKTAKLPGGAVETVSSFDFDIAAYGAGQLAGQTVSGTYGAWAGQGGTELSYAQDFAYDELGRPQSSQTTVDGQNYLTFQEYDLLGRPWRALDASGLWTKTQYGPRGPIAICASDDMDVNVACGSGPETYQRTLATNAWGNVVRERRGESAAMEIVRQYHAQTGRIAEICAGNAACNLVKEAYAWDAAGNLSTHQKEGRYLETFVYDALNRLTEGRLAWANGVPINQTTLLNAYDGVGNICSKNGTGYAYPGGDGCVGALAMPVAGQMEAARNLSNYLLPVDKRASSGAAARSAASISSQRTAWQPAGGDSRRASTSRPKVLQRSALATRSKFSHARTVSTSTPSLLSTHNIVALGAITGSPHAVSQTGQGATAEFYYYDERGNQTQRDAPGTANDRTIRYSADGKAHEIQMGGGQRVRFWYGPDGQRYKREEAGKVTLYLGGVELVIQGGLTTARRVIGGIVQQTVVGGAVQATRYLFHDHLGSVVRIADANGALAEGLDFTAFGERRSYSDPNGAGSASPTTTRGFTGHEMVDGTGVIHMNGRIYDAALGRFLQPDPLVQSPDNAQSWNAYTYVFNNPLAYTDPTGMFSARQFLGFFVAVVMTIVAPQTAGFWYAMATGFVSGYVATGTFRGGVIGAFSAGVTFGIANAGGLDAWQKVGLHATTGGIVESLSGGSFGHGFLAAGLTASVMPQVGKIGNDITRTAVGALVGGTLSVATGGKFANGAVSGAIQGALARNSVQKREGRRAQPKVPIQEATGAPTREIAQWMRSHKPEDRILAARAAIEYFQIRGDGYELFYSPHLSDASGQVNPFGQVELGPMAFESWSELGVTLGHEIEIHWELQFKKFGAVSSNQEWFMREYQADLYELENISRFGLTPRQISNTNYYVNKHFNALKEGNKDLVRVGIYEEPGH
ncbi:TPA: VCBS repeat-containing protein [Pseudomonas aeruginosa]|nr:VCBS repeat-containing protein [Pseudomonas aeruginosa]